MGSVVESYEYAGARNRRTATVRKRISLQIQILPMIQKRIKGRIRSGMFLRIFIVAFILFLASARTLTLQGTH